MGDKLLQRALLLIHDRPPQSIICIVQTGNFTRIGMYLAISKNRIILTKPGDFDKIFCVSLMLEQEVA